MDKKIISCNSVSYVDLTSRKVAELIQNSVGEIKVIAEEVKTREFKAQESSEETKLGLKMSEVLKTGIVISEMFDYGPFAEPGLKTGMKILGINWCLIYPNMRFPSGDYMK